MKIFHVLFFFILILSIQTQTNNETINNNNNNTKIISNNNLNNSSLNNNKDNINKTSKNNKNNNINNTVGNSHKNKKQEYTVKKKITINNTNNREISQMDVPDVDKVKVIQNNSQNQKNSNKNKESAKQNDIKQNKENIKININLNNTEKEKEDKKNKLKEGVIIPNPEIKPFNLTESLINFFLETFGNKSNTTNTTKEAENKKKLEEEEKKRKEEQAKIEQIKMEEKKKKEKEDKPFNLTESLINFFNKTLGDLGKKDKEAQQRTKEEIEEMRRRKEEENQRRAQQEREMKRRREAYEARQSEMIRIENKRKEEKKKKEKEEREKFDKIISNTTFEEHIQISLGRGETETLYLDLESFTKIKIAIAVTDIEQQEKINFFFSGPNARGRTAVIYQMYNKNHLFWEYETLRKGEFYAEITNKGTKDNEIYFYFSQMTDKKKDNINTEKIDKISMLLNDIDKNVNEVRNKKKMEIKQANLHNDKVKENNKWIVIYSLIEICTMITVFMIQNCYINSIINKL